MNEFNIGEWIDWEAEMFCRCGVKQKKVAAKSAT